MNETNQISFHEATVRTFARDSDAVILELEDVLTSKGKSIAVITVNGTTGLEIDNADQNTPLMEAADGEILSLTVHDTGIYAIIEWNDFVHKRSWTRVYSVHGTPSIVFLSES